MIMNWLFKVKRLLGFDVKMRVGVYISPDELPMGVDDYVEYLLESYGADIVCVYFDYAYDKADITITYF
jgi:hypothetical protein